MQCMQKMWEIFGEAIVILLFNQINKIINKKKTIHTKSNCTVYAIIRCNARLIEIEGDRIIVEI